MSSSQLTHIFQRGRLKPPTRFTGLKQWDPAQIYHFYGWDWNDQSIWVVYGIALLALHLVVLRTIHFNIYKHSNNQSKINIPIVDVLDMICIGIVSKLDFHSTIYPFWLSLWYPYIYIYIYWNGHIFVSQYIPHYLGFAEDVFLHGKSTTWGIYRDFFFVVDNLLGNIYIYISYYIIIYIYICAYIYIHIYLYKLERAQPRNEVGFVDLTSPATR